MTEFVVFYSWQSDLPNRTNRGLIGKALEQAAKELREDESIRVDPVIDRDTLGKPGSPGIAETIFDKIDASQAFVCDISLITRPNASRPSPNPNVLVELGYALKTMGPEMIIMVFNKAYGKVVDLPFDLRSRRVVTYSASATEEGDNRNAAREELKRDLVKGLISLVAEFNKPMHYSVTIPPNAAPIIRNAAQSIDSPSIETRKEAIEVLSQISDSMAKEILVQALGHQLPDVATSAAVALARSGDERAIQVLIASKPGLDHLTGPDVVAKALLSYGSSALPAICEALPKADRYDCAGLAAILGHIRDPRAVPYIVEAIGRKGNKWHDNESLISALEEIGDESAAAALLSILKDDPDDANRSRAAEALGRIDSSAVVTGLCNALCDASAVVRKHASRALGCLCDRGAIPELIKALQDDDDGVRKAAVASLGKIGDESAVTALLSVLGVDDQYARILAIEALGAIGEPSVVGRLCQALPGTNYEERVAIVRVLGKLQSSEAMPFLIALLSDAEKPSNRWVAQNPVCQVAAEALEAIGTPEAFETAKHWRRYSDLSS